MGKKFKNIVTFLIIAAVLLMSVTAADAAEINSIPANIGDTVEYELHVLPCPNSIQALDVVIYYDSNSLEYVPYSLELSNISGFMTNTDISGELRFNAMDFNGFVFDVDKILAKVQFTVKDLYSENPNLSFEIKAFLDSTTTDLGNTYIYDVTSINGRTMENTDTDEQDIQTDSDVESSELEFESEAESSQTELTESSEPVDLSSQMRVVSEEYESRDITLAVMEPFTIVEDTELSESSQISQQEKNKLYVLFSISAAVIVTVLGFAMGTAAKRIKKDDDLS